MKTKPKRKRSLKISKSAVKHSKVTPKLHQQLLHLFEPVPAAEMLKAIILVAILVVACIGLFLDVKEAVFWTFLSVMAGYAALTNKDRVT